MSFHFHVSVVLLLFLNWDENYSFNLSQTRRSIIIIKRRQIALSSFVLVVRPNLLFDMLSIFLKSKIFHNPEKRTGWKTEKCYQSDITLTKIGTACSCFKIFFKLLFFIVLKLSFCLELFEDVFWFLLQKMYRFKFPFYVL